jgi:hypothetical protein
MDRIDTPPSLYRPYLKSTLGVIIVHIVIGAPFSIEAKMENEFFLTLAWQDFPSLPLVNH